MQAIVRFLLILVLSSTSMLPRADAQCGQWSPGFGAAGFDGAVRASLVFDDGTGPALYVGGAFTHVGGVVARHLARWDGATWQGVGGGTDGEVFALALFDDGSGIGLYVGGNFVHAGGAAHQSVARWNGSAWSGLAAGVDGTVFAMTTYDDGGGTALFVGGSFYLNGAPSTVARWSGASWSLPAFRTDGAVRALCVYDHGTGPGLFVGGDFPFAGVGIGLSNLYAFLLRWDGAQLSHASPWLASSNGPGVRSLAVHDDGSGAKLYVGGNMALAAAGSPRFDLATWNGTTWDLIAGEVRGDSTSGRIESLLVHDAGTGPELYVGGTFTTLATTPALRIGRWNGTSFAQVGAGFDAVPQTLAAFDGGSGVELFAGGGFTSSGTRAMSSFARFDGVHWRAMASGNGIAGHVNDVVAFDDGSGMALYAAGRFLAAGEVAAPNIARWNGTQWGPVGAGLPGLFGVGALAVFDDGTGPALYATSMQAWLVRWNGTSWSAVGNAGPITGYPAKDLAVFDGGFGPGLYVMGPNIVTRWNGVSFATVYHSIDPFNHSTVMAVLGSRLYLGRTCEIGVFDGVSWQSLFVNGGISALAAHAGSLYACGDFYDIGEMGNGVRQFARFDGSTWSSGASFAPNEGVTGFASLDLGTGAGPELFVVGVFDSIDGVPADNAARLSGATWSGLGAGFECFPSWQTAMATFPSPLHDGSDLFVAGDVTRAGSWSSNHIARWQDCGGPGSAFCAGDGLDGSVTTWCPCANFGALGRGCANSANAAGAQLVGVGSTNLDTVVLHASSMPMTASATFLQGDGLTDTPYGDGVRCIDGSLIRLRTKINVGGASRFPDASDTVTLSQRGLVTPGSGAVRHYQANYRNAATLFCPPQTFNVTNGWTIVW